MQKRLLFIALVLIAFTGIGWYLITTADQVVPPHPELQGLVENAPEGDLNQSNGTEAGDVASEVNAIYVKGGYSEELWQKQSLAQTRGQIYYTLIDNLEEMTQLIHQYQLVGEGTELRYASAFFSDRLVVAIFPEQTSSAISFVVTDVKKQSEGWQIIIEEIIPGEYPADIINRGIFVEINQAQVQNPDAFEILLTKKRVDFQR